MSAKSARRPALHTYHRFFDEAGDTTFYGKGHTLLLGREGVSKCFILGMLKIKEPLEPLREKLTALQSAIAKDPYYRGIPSVQKKTNNHGFFLHAKDDPPEIRKQAFELIASVKCSFEAVVARKIEWIYVNKHASKDSEFYADMLGHLLKNKLQKYEKLVLNVAMRGTSTSTNNLTRGLELAKSRFISRTPTTPMDAQILFNVQSPISEPLLNIADYFCWAVQRVFERGETRYYDFLCDKISRVIDLYDSTKYAGAGNYYGPKNPLTKANCL